jgi:hypothetical protein
VQVVSARGSPPFPAAPPTILRLYGNFDFIRKVGYPTGCFKSPAPYFLAYAVM